MDTIRQIALHVSPEVLALGFLVLATACAIVELIWRRISLFPDPTEICVFVLKTICASIVVYLGHRLITWLECREWSYPISAVKDEGASFVERDPVVPLPSTPRPPRMPLTLQRPGAMGRSGGLAVVTPETPRTAIWNPRASTSASWRPTHHSGILGPSPNPLAFFNADNYIPRGSLGYEHQVPTTHQAEQATPNAHPRRFGYNGTPATAGFKHFSGLGFAEQRERLRGLGRMRGFEKLVEEDEGECED